MRRALAFVATAWGLGCAEVSGLDEIHRADERPAPATVKNVRCGGSMCPQGAACCTDLNASSGHCIEAGSNCEGTVTLKCDDDVDCADADAGKDSACCVTALESSGLLAACLPRAQCVSALQQLTCIPDAAAPCASGSCKSLKFGLLTCQP